MSAPVCAVNPPSPIVEPLPRLLPTVPIATDMASALAAINALRQIILMMTNAIPANGAQGAQGPAGPPAKKTQSNFKQTSIAQVDVTIPVRDGDGNQIGTAVVGQVNKLVLTNPVTLETWTFTRNG